VLAASLYVFLTLISWFNWHPMRWRALSISPYVEGAKVIAALEARLNAEYDAIVDAHRPPHWPCEPLR
jgi:hypothetical protein